MQRREGTRLRNSTVSRCAQALGVSVDDLRNAPIVQLLSRRGAKAVLNSEPDAKTRRHYERAMQPELEAWLQRNPQRAAELTHEEMDELVSLQGTGGPLTRLGVEHFVSLVERKRKLLDQIHAVAGTEYLDVLEKIVQLMYEKIQPYRDGA
jgi:hypothetical protein